MSQRQLKLRKLLTQFAVSPAVAVDLAVIRSAAANMAGIGARSHVCNPISQLTRLRGLPSDWHRRGCHSSSTALVLPAHDGTTRCESQRGKLPWPASVVLSPLGTSERLVVARSSVFSSIANTLLLPGTQPRGLQPLPWLQHPKSASVSCPIRFLSNTPGANSSSDKTPSPAAADVVYNLPNAVSAARLVSGPVIGYWLLQGHYEAATIALAISGASDWLDGFLARRMGASSVFGSYLDPLADKVLIGCVAGALLLDGVMPTWLAIVVVGRDLLLVTGAFAFRLRGFGWRWPGREAFFRTADDMSASMSVSAVNTAAAAMSSSQPGAIPAKGRVMGKGDSGETGVAFMQPLLISKANTVLQLVLLGGYLMRGMYGWPDGDPVFALEAATAATTTLSLAAYGTMAVQGKLFK
ncbi:hypothetical protein Vretimale_9133 [Volvox reticuliferus]|uniref:Uncharacterized protein n=1 Tax=Volvox reticuliferus TaxID=1737510 RepID=A0A8J4GCW4_9CHLO|nr:hypothetical protein Vretifemale_9815 [Volvox reticuliferus]GIM04583.1 hypothetical protein Vretimale_9133 [Volvox reticuliferus]